MHLVAILPITCEIQNIAQTGITNGLGLYYTCTCIADLLSARIIMFTRINFANVYKIFITHRRSVAKRGGCFQQRLFVCLFVSFLSTLYKISPEFEFGGQRSNVKVTRNKKRKSATFFREQSSRARVVSSASSTPVGKSSHAV